MLFQVDFGYNRWHFPVSRSLKFQPILNNYNIKGPENVLMGYYQNQHTDKPVHKTDHLSRSALPICILWCVLELVRQIIFGSQFLWETLCARDLRAGSLDHSLQLCERSRVGWMGLKETWGCVAGMTGPSGSHGVLWSCMTWQGWGESWHRTSNINQPLDVGCGLPWERSRLRQGDFLQLGELPKSVPATSWDCLSSWTAPDLKTSLSAPPLQYVCSHGWVMITKTAIGSITSKSLEKKSHKIATV